MTKLVHLELIVGFHTTSQVMFYRSNPRDVIEITPEASQKVWNKSPDGFAWGYGGSGPAQLALAILLELTSKDEALKHFQGFKADILVKLDTDMDFRISGDLVRRWFADNDIIF